MQAPLLLVIAVVAFVQATSFQRPNTNEWVSIQVSESLLASLQADPNAADQFKVIASPSGQQKVGVTKLNITAKQFGAFSDILFKLKDTRRGAWTRMNLYEDVESIADHMYRLAMLIMVSNPSGVNRDRCVLMALVHDLAEALVGDITPVDGIPKEEKSRRELSAMIEITANLPQETANELMDLWNEYEAGLTAEAKLVKEMDKFEFGLTSYDYERSEKHLAMKDFRWAEVDYFWRQVEPKLKLTKPIYYALAEERLSKVKLPETPYVPKDQY